MYIHDLPTYLVFYLETTHGSSIDPPTMDNDNDDNNDGNDTLTLAARGLEELFSSCGFVSVFGSGGK